MSKWLLDAGHGGTDPGAVYQGRKESVDVLKLTKRVGEILITNGETIGYTRTSDMALSLTERTNVANKNNYDYLVSIHRNATPGGYGVETYVYTGYSNKADGSLATKVNNEIVSASGYRNRGVKEGNLHMVRESKCTAILVEIGFIDSVSDNVIFDNKFEAIAQSMAKGCLAHIGKIIAGTTPTPPPSTGEMYRVRKSWADSTSQIGAYSNLDNAKALCDKKPGYSVFNNAGSKVYPVVVTPPTPPVQSKRYLNLKPHMAKWAVYNQNGPYIVSKKIGEVLPKNYGGLSYEILGEKGNDVYIISTGSYGKCAIWAPKDNDSTITSKASYNNGNSTPAPSNKQYLNLKPHNATWSVYKENGPYTTANAIGKLAPAQYGGISYEILASKGNDVYVISTGSFGRCGIWVPKDNDSSFTSYPVY